MRTQTKGNVKEKIANAGEFIWLASPFAVLVSLGWAIQSAAESSLPSENLSQWKKNRHIQYLDQDRQSKITSYCAKTVLVKILDDGQAVISQRNFEEHQACLDGNLDKNDQFSPHSPTEDKSSYGQSAAN